jgi:hypothetical protein
MQIGVPTTDENKSASKTLVLEASSFKDDVRLDPNATKLDMIAAWMGVLEEKLKFLRVEVKNNTELANQALLQQRQRQQQNLS